MIHVILGTKAQLIKMAPVMYELQKRKIPYNFIFTGQHKETMKDLMSVFKLKKPDYILYKGKDITKISQMFIWFLKCFFKTLFKKREIFKNDRTGLVVIHGDTFSTLLGALIGKITGHKVAHIESGLRSFNYFNPFPEEITRIMVFKFTNYYFCPGKWALNNLSNRKGVKINTKANTLYDSLQLAIRNLKGVKVKIPNEEYALVSLHRFENIYKKERFKEIIEILNNISKKIKLLFILHKPTKTNLRKFGFYNILEKNKNIELRPRYDYFKFIKLLNNSEFLISDGGSNQEESYYLGKPCLLLRYKTERKEGLGKNVCLSKFDKDKINYFIKNYKKFRTKYEGQKISPTKIIVNKLESLNG